MRKYKGTYKIPIKKHTKVRRPISNYVALSKWHDIYGINNNPLVQDIKRGLENPLDIEQVIVDKTQVVINAIFEDLTEQTRYSSRESYNNGLKKELNILQSKSLLERMKARFK